jgi:putative ABC transport system permease protein
VSTLFSQYLIRQQRVPTRLRAQRAGRRTTLAGLAAIALPVLCAVPARAQEIPGPGGGCPRDLDILVERRLAEPLDLSTGSDIRVSSSPGLPGCGATVAGVYEPGADPAELARDRRRVILHLPDLAELAGREDEVDRFTILLTEDGEAESTAARLDALMPGTRTLGGSEVAARASTTFEVVRRFHRAIGLITITAGGVFLACIMTLKVQERRSQVAALRLVGISNRTLLAWLMLEAALVSALGGLLGIGIGRAASAIINAWYQRVYSTTLEFSIVTGETVAIGLLLAVVLGLLAGGVGAVRLLQVDALREVGR